jgi:DNA-binding MarR family transcriptional regulator
VDLTNYGKTVLYGITKYPNANDRYIAEKFDIKQSTVAAIRRKLKDDNYYKLYAIPMIQNLGAELMVVTYTNFNPVIPLEKRITITKETIEAAEEIFFSFGEEDKGFSVSFSKDYSSIGKINDVRTMTFGKLGLLDNEYPDEVVFPFSNSKIYSFFDFSPLLNQLFEMDDNCRDTSNFFPKRHASLSPREQKVLCKIVQYPDFSSKKLAEILGITRHTVGRLKNKFLENGYIKFIVIPNFLKLNLNILAFCHIPLNPHNPPHFEDEDLKDLLCEEMIFFSARRFEFVALSMHPNFESYKYCKTLLMQKLKENNWISHNTNIRTYGLHKSRVIKNFTFLPIVQKIMGCGTKNKVK